jgi:hypothetical protein
MKGPVQKMILDLQDKLDVQEVVCRLFLAGTMPMVENEYDDARAGERRLTLRQPAELSKFALVCKAWHKALQKHRQQQIDAAARFCIDAAPMEAISIVNIDSYPVHTWTTLPKVSELHLQVWLGSHLKFAIHFMRVGAPPRLTITCGVPPRTDGGHWYSGPNHVTVDELCWKPEENFEFEETAQYTAWCDATIAHVHAWCKAQYALMTAAAPDVPAEAE